MEYRKEKSKIIIIVVLILMIIGLAGLMYYDKFIEKKEREKNSINEKSEETTKQDEKKESREYIIKFYDDDKYLFSKTVDSDSTVEEPNIPQKQGYVFVAWYLDNEKFDFNTKITSDIVLSAKWKKENVVANKKTYLVKFALYEGKTTTQTVSEENTVIKPANPSRAGYIFKGWEVDGSTYDFNKKITKNITINAKWRKISTINEEKLNLASMNHKSLKNKLGGTKNNGIESYAHYNTDRGRGYYSAGYITYNNGYVGRFEFWTFENEEFNTVLDSVNVKSLIIPLKDLFKDYSTFSLTDENLKAFGAKNILRVKENDLLQFVYGHYTIEIYNLSATGQEHLFIWDDNYVENDSTD